MLPLAINFAKHPRVQSTSCWYTIRWANTARPSQTIFFLVHQPSLPKILSCQLSKPPSS